MHKNQKGFSFVEVLVVILVLGLLGLAGWYVMNRSKTAGDQTTTTQSQNEDQTNLDTAETETPPEGYQEYKNTELGFRFYYPTDWGEVSVTQRARNREDYEPVKTYFLSFDPKFMIKISPNNWSFTGGASEWDFPLTKDTFAQLRDETDSSLLNVVKADDSFLHMTWNAMSGGVELSGAKLLTLSKIPSEVVEFDWAPVSDNCATDLGNEMKKPKLECYSQANVDATKEVINSFKSL